MRVALRSSGPPNYERQRKGSVVDAVEPEILELLREFPDMAATVVAERIGWQHSIRVLRERVPAAMLQWDCLLHELIQR